MPVTRQTPSVEGGVVEPFNGKSHPFDFTKALVLHHRLRLGAGFGERTRSAVGLLRPLSYDRNGVLHGPVCPGLS